MKKSQRQEILAGCWGRANYRHYGLSYEAVEEDEEWYRKLEETTAMMEIEG